MAYTGIRDVKNISEEIRVTPQVNFKDVGHLCSQDMDKP